MLEHQTETEQNKEGQPGRTRAGFTVDHEEFVLPTPGQVDHVEVGQGGEAVMECVTRNLANNNLVRSKWWSEVV